MAGKAPATRRARRVDPPVTAAAKRDLAALDKRLAGTSRSVEAEAILRLAADLDGNLDAPLSARVAAARELREAMEALRGRVPEEQAGDRLDELAERRSRRVAAK